MSVENKYETRMVEQTICTERIRRCDVCDNEIDTDKEYWTANAAFRKCRYPYPSSHRFELYDMCSEDCVHKQLDKFLNEATAVHFEVDKHSYFTWV